MMLQEIEEMFPVYIGGFHTDLDIFYIVFAGEVDNVFD